MYMQVQKSPGAMHMGTRPVNSKVTVIQLIQCVVLFCVQMQNLDHDPVDMDEENAEVTNSLEVRHTMLHGIFTCMK